MGGDFEPISHVVCVKSEAEYVGWNESNLRRVQSDHADENTICAGDHPSFPAPFTDQDRRTDRENTGYII